ncbi:5-deoxy-glucuronate isomerase [Agromyces hippuratus]|uniref:5-deoxy-glucuronate isomerase n=1 Tax=Agromyces hippuratus TaxID=286438 RepID=A0A852X770_9MICO|nr:5-deoxy-glucuronate isomerase [Agromyces hippuratus]NYG21811.1 5-deoxy-glucuronate isomerase [Agromyces hippuratus]
MTERTTATTHETWFHPRASLARDGWDVVVDASLDGWQHTGLRVAALDVGGAGLELPAGAVERLVVPLEGGCLVRAIAEDGTVHEVELEGRASVFDGPTDCLYLPVGASATLTGTASGAGPGRVAVAEAPATTRHPLRRIGRDEVPVELRGRGRASRQVHDLGTPAVLDAERLIVCEVITPAGNWSSYPPHKHDEELPGHESQLEEIYYFELAPAPGSLEAAGAATAPYGLFSAASSAVTAIELDERVRDGDVALVPGGFHGPAVAPPTHDLYYLNVMAGPGDRVWRITDEPEHGWVRESWQHEPADDRLPYNRTTKGARP